jgi:hypothetical protein
MPMFEASDHLVDAKYFFAWLVALPPTLADDASWTRDCYLNSTKSV